MQSNSTAAPTRRSWLLFIIDHNPCYLLSGACMLIGCRLLISVLHTPAGDVKKLLLLLGIINLYELLLVILGLVLIKRIAFKRDGRILLALQALFLVDITFTSGIISTIDLGSGIFINAALLILAAFKVSFILHNLKLPRAGRISFFITLQIALLLAIPLIYKWIAGNRNGNLTPLVVYATWWLAALLPMLGLLLHRLPTRPRLLEPHGIERAMGILFITLPFISLLVHLYSAAWVYDIDFVSAFAAPVLLGLALAANLLEGPRLQRYLIARLQLFSIAGAIWLSTDFPRQLLFYVNDGKIALTPLRLILIASALIFIYLIWRHDNLFYLWTALLCLTAAALGPTTSLIWHNLISLLTSSRRLIPRTTLAWGITSVAASFALLFLGGILSLRKNLSLHRPVVLIPDVPTQ
jgi:hypothetical protein